MDYSETLGRIATGVNATAQRVDVLAKSPALAMTLAQIDGQIAAAKSEARRGDAQLVAEARRGSTSRRSSLPAWSRRVVVRTSRSCG